MAIHTHRVLGAGRAALVVGAIMSCTLITSGVAFATGTATADDPGNSATATITRTDCRPDQAISTALAAHGATDIVFGSFRGQTGADSVSVDFREVYQADESLPGSTLQLRVYCSPSNDEPSLDCYDVTFASTAPLAIASIVPTHGVCARIGPVGSAPGGTVWIGLVAVLTGLMLLLLARRSHI